MSEGNCCCCAYLTPPWWVTMGFVPPTGAGGQGSGVIQQPLAPGVALNSGPYATPNPPILAGSPSGGTTGSTNQPPSGVGTTVSGTTSSTLNPNAGPTQTGVGAPASVPIMTPYDAAAINHLMGSLPIGWVMGSDGQTPVYVGAGLPIMTPQQASLIFEETGQFPLGWETTGVRTNNPESPYGVPTSPVYEGGVASGPQIKRRINSDVLEPLGSMIHLL
jgi:hypothetical protein